ncbi:glycosyl transferase group 1 [Chloroherpeton thalassium ATCC 35110]|uniref:Glycosyl transferase group 1 n=1 Tax=Chloroherpeton thalassium (strain ATCC 35110 / GB-78) TaxID=517418 RepID=B3QU58_CHLT3|nr:glycosyltransferase family 1 protein [Chloroherpeton thalassium]ACF12856.1 glycosyl transferase group 1 [Chloroherpeton thalassium ATCC 35110]
MKLTLTSCLTQNCGIGRYTHELASYFHQSGLEVTLYRKDGGAEPYIKGYPYRSFKNLRYYVAPYYLSKALESVESDIWHADYVDAGWALALAKKSRQPVIVTAHDAIPFIYAKPLDRWVYQYELKKTTEIADAIIVVSQKSKDDLIRHAQIPEEKIHVVHNGINHDFFYPEPNRKENSVFTIRYIGGLAKHKNVESLIYTALLLERKNITCKIQIGGGFHQQTTLPKLVRELKVQNVEFKGFISNDKLRAFLASADVFLYPSLYEGFGFPPLEAMACGTATVSSNRGSLPEVLQNGAICCEPTPENFANAIESLYRHPSKLHALRERGLKTAAEYTWEKTAKQTLGIYGRL